MPSKKTNLRIVLPKSTMDNSSKDNRRANVTVDENGQAWMEATDALRILGTTPQALLELMPEYRKVAELIDLEQKWDGLKRIYNTMPEVFDQEAMLRHPTIKAARAMLRLNMRPFYALALMDLAMLKLVLSAVRRGGEHPKKAVCKFCGAENARLRCLPCKDLGCVEIFYCSKECQTGDWKFHKKMCAKTLMSQGDLKALAAQPATMESKLAVVGDIMRLCERMKIAEDGNAAHDV